MSLKPDGAQTAGEFICCLQHALRTRLTPYPLCLCGLIERVANDDRLLPLSAGGDQIDRRLDQRLEAV